MVSKIIINKKKCICGGNLKKQINFGELPIINNFKKTKTSKYPTVVTQCKKCLLIQLKYSVADELVFPKNYSYLSSDSKEKLEDFNDLIKKLKSRFKFKKPSIIDIGGNDGALMKCAKKLGFKVLNVEPTNVALISKKNGVSTLQKKFDFNLAKILNKKKIKFNFVASTNFFAHTNDLKNIINGSKLILDKNGVMVIEVHYLYRVIKNNGFDSFHQDHKYYYSINSLKKILKKFSLNVFDAEFLKKNNEILRVFVDNNVRSNTIRLNKLIKNENDKNVFKKLIKLNEFRKKYVLKLKKVINKLHSKNYKIYGISAAPRGCVLLNSANFSNKQIKMVGEVPKSFKLNKFIPGSNIPIKNEKIIIKNKPNYVIILAWHLQKRLKKILVKNGFKGKFIIPLPKLKIS